MSVVEIQVEDEADARPPEYSDEALALRFATARGEDLRYIAAWGRWYEWSGVVWAPDDTLAAYDLVRRECRAAAADLTAQNSSDTGKRQAAKVASGSTVAAVERLARVDLPSEVREVHVFADADDAGREAAEKAVRRFRRDGLKARAFLPPDGAKDMNEALMVEGRACA